jgi:two-component system OmpR family response regulator/two-component system alkaline phosphatase synthesis response regulator PhoP
MGVDAGVESEVKIYFATGSVPMLDSITPKSILVVDDEPLVADTLRLLLRMDNHRVELASDGETALARYEEGQFDLVITDLLMPGMDGLELARLIKARVPEQRILLATGHLEAVSNNEKMRQNIDGLLAKPFSPEELREALKAVSPAV